MIKVILEEKKPEMHISDITDNSIVGILWTDGIKSYLIKDGANIVHVGNNNNTAYPMNGMTSKKNYIIDLNSNEAVYVFNDMKELFKWLSE